jgi:predicted thioesterase
MNGPQPGQLAEAVHTVRVADTAEAIGSGDVPVLATPRLLTWMEAATVEAVPGDQSRASVGTRVELDHLVASPVGAEVTVRAELSAVDGRLMRFEVVASHADGKVVAHGRVTRVVVDRERFLARASLT